jgi:RNA polymerase sigma-70 factor, ECF subfamily
MGNPEPGDEVLVARARLGDVPAFELLVRRHALVGLAVARSIVGNVIDAEDVCQDAWVRALERLDECRRPDRFASWLLQIVRNRARNFLQYRRVRATEPFDEAIDASDQSKADDPSEALDRRREQVRLECAMARLTEVQREVLILHDQLGWKHREIAESVGVSEVLSRQRLFQARARMRQFLDEVADGERQ